MKLTTRPLTPDLWPAFEDLFGENGAVGGCWRMYWRIGRAYRKKPREENKTAFREIVERGPAAGSARLRRRYRCGLVSVDAAGRAPVAGSRVAAQAGGRCAGLVALLLLCTQGLSEEGRHGDVDRSGFECGNAREGARARSLSA